MYLAETGSAKAALPLLQAAAGDPSDLDALNALGIAYGHLNDDRASARQLSDDRADRSAERAGVSEHRIGRGAAR